MDKSKDHGQAIKIFVYNLQYQLKEEGYKGNPILREMGEMFVRHVQPLAIHQERLRTLASSLEKIKRSISLGYGNSVKKLETSCISITTDLYNSFVKYVISEKNRQTPLTIERVTTSVSNKFWRLVGQGEIFDKTPEYPVLIEDIEKKIKQLHLDIDKIESCTKEKKCRDTLSITNYIYNQ